MNPHWNSYLNRRISRRDLLRASSTGFGALALAGMLGEELSAAGTTGQGAPGPLAVKPPHFAPKAKRVIFLFMHGGPSQVDTFDYKPLLQRDHGKPLPFQRPKVVSSETFNLLKSPWEFKQHGQSGMWVSDLFPEFAKRVDDVCFIKSMWGSNSRHGGALLAFPILPIPRRRRTFSGWNWTSRSASIASNWNRRDRMRRWRDALRRSSWPS